MRLFKTPEEALAELREGYEPLWQSVPPPPPPYTPPEYDFNILGLYPGLEELNHKPKREETDSQRMRRQIHEGMLAEERKIKAKPATSFGTIYGETGPVRWWWLVAGFWIAFDFVALVLTLFWVTHVVAF